MQFLIRDKTFFNLIQSLKLVGEKFNEQKIISPI